MNAFKQKLEIIAYTKKYSAKAAARKFDISRQGADKLVAQEEELLLLLAQAQEADEYK